MVSNPASIETCPSCGSPLEKPGLTECPICGFDLTQLEPPLPPQPEPVPEPVFAPSPLPQPTLVVPEKGIPEPVPPGKPRSTSRKRHAPKSGKAASPAPAPALPSLVEQYQALLLEATRLEQTNDLDAALAAYRRALAFAEANRKADISLELAVQALGPLVRRTEQMQAPRPVKVPDTLPGKASAVPPGFPPEFLDSQGQIPGQFSFDPERQEWARKDAAGQPVQVVRLDSSGRVSVAWQVKQGTPSVVLYDWSGGESAQEYSGDALLPWRDALDQTLEELKTILRLQKRIPEFAQVLFAREVGDKLLVLFTDQTYSLPKSILSTPANLRASLSGISKQAAGAKYVLVSPGEASGVDFGALFPGALPLYIEGMDENQIVKNITSLREPHKSRDGTGSIINGIPLPDQLEAVGLQGQDPKIWAGKAAALDDILRDANRPSPPAAPPASIVPPPPAVDTQAQQAALREITRMSAGKTMAPMVTELTAPPTADLGESAKRLQDYDQVPWLFSKEPVAPVSPAPEKKNRIGRTVLIGLGIVFVALLCIGILFGLSGVGLASLSFLRTSTPTRTPTWTPTRTPIPTRTPTRTSTPAISPVQTLSSPTQIKIYDTFVSYANGWPYRDNYSDDCGVENFNIQVGILKWDLVNKNDCLWYEKPQLGVLGDFNYFIDVRHISGDPTDDYGVIFHDQGSEYYYFGISEGNQDFLFSIYTQGAWKSLVDWTDSSVIRNGEVNRIGVIAKGPIYQFYINDSMVATYDDDTLLYGENGVAAEPRGQEMVLEYDNFELTANPYVQ